jgi:signal peptidase II
VNRSPSLLFGVALTSVLLDQWTKHWATDHLAFREPVNVIGELVRFTYTRNSGIAFGMFAGKSFPFYIFSVVAALAVFWLWSRHPKLPWPRQWSLALILGGAIGNLIDRVRHGEVVDFILLSWRGHEFPVFNVADMCVTCGVILFALVWTHEPREPAEPALAGAPPDMAGGPQLASAAPELASAPALAPEKGGLGPNAGVAGAGDGGGSALGPVAGEGPEHRPVP